MDGTHDLQRDFVVAGERRPRRALEPLGRARFELHVAGISRAQVALVHLHRIIVCLAQLGEEFRSQPVDDGAPAAARLHQMLVRLARAIVVIEVFGGQKAKLAQERRGKDRRPVQPRQRVRIVPEPMELRLAAVQDFAHPAKVIEAEVIERALGGRQAEHVRDVLEELRRCVADADDAGAGRRAHRLCDDPDRVGEIDDPRVRRAARHLARVAHHVRDGPHGHGKTAGANRFLSDYAVRHRRRFVPRASFDAADANAGEHVRGAIDARAARLARDESRVAGEPSRQRRDRRETRCVRIVERDLTNGKVRADETAHEQRRADAASADDGDLHGASIRRLAGRSRARGSASMPPTARVDIAPTKLPVSRLRRGEPPRNRA